MKAIIALTGWISIVTIASLIPIDSPELDSFIDYDKVVHIAFYLVMSYLLSRSIAKHEIKYIMLSVLLCSLYGYLIEYLQGALDLGRYFDYYDIIANIIGSFIGAFIYRLTI